MNKITKDEALKLALVALEECRRDPRLKYEHPYYDKTITAICEALADQRCPTCNGNDGNMPCAYPSEGQSGCLRDARLKPVQQEPVAIVDAGDDGYWAEILPDRNVKVGQLLYTSPQPNKPWVHATTWRGLTDEEARTLVDRHCGTLLAVSQVLDRMQLTRTIEAKLREKNEHREKNA